MNFKYVLLISILTITLFGCRQKSHIKGAVYSRDEYSIEYSVTTVNSQDIAKMLKVHEEHGWHLIKSVHVARTELWQLTFTRNEVKQENGHKRMVTHPDYVPDNVVVLARKNGKYGAFIMRKQRTTLWGERAEYDWWFQSDGSGIFDTNISTTSSGHGTTPRIAFGNIFSITWSIRRKGIGYLYYWRSLLPESASNDLHLCVTDLSSIDGIDATDLKWKYITASLDSDHDSANKPHKH